MGELSKEHIRIRRLYARPDAEPEVKDKDRLIQQVRAWKGSKFEPRFVKQQIARLEELGYLVPSST